MRGVLRQVEHENADLKFLNTQYAHKLRVQEADNQAKTERIQRLLEKNLDAVVEVADGTKRRIATRKQRMEIKTFGEPAVASAAAAAAAPTRLLPLPQHEIDVLKIADVKVQQLEQNIHKLEDDKRQVPWLGHHVPTAPPRLPPVPLELEPPCTVQCVCLTIPAPIAICVLAGQPPRIVQPLYP